MSDPFGTVAPMQSTQTQMRRRERKRLKREEKRRSHAAAAPHCASLTRPDLSDSFHEFVRPLIKRLPPDYSGDRLKRPLVIAAAVWNAVVAAEGDIVLAAAFVEGMVSEGQQKPVLPTLRAVIQALAVGKATYFCDDHRIVMGVEVHREGADVRVVARAMTPPTNTVIRGEDSPGRNV